MSKDMKLIMENWNKFVMEEEVLNEIDADLKDLLGAFEDNIDDLKDEEGKQPQNEILGMAAAGTLMFGIMTKGSAGAALVEYILKKMKDFAKKEYRWDPEQESNEEKALAKVIKVVQNMKNGLATLGLHTVAKFILPKIGLFASDEAKEKLDNVMDVVSLVIGMGGLVLSGYTSVIEGATKGQTAGQGLVQAMSSAFDVTSDTVEKVIEIFDNASDLKQAVLGSLRLIRLLMTR